MISSFWFDTINFDGPLYISMRHRFPKSKIVFCFAVDRFSGPDEMPRDAAFHQVFTACLSAHL